MIDLSEKDWEHKLLMNIRRNMFSILEKYYESNQAQMAKDLGVRPNTLYTYLNTDTKPPITFLYKLCSRHDLSIDLFLNDELAVDVDRIKKKQAARQFYSKYVGSYYTYFFVVDSYSLKEGLIQEGCIDICESGRLNYEIFNAAKQFAGILSASEELIYFDLKNSKEKINIVIKNPGKNIKEKYLGGMGVANISSPEDNRIPCAQKVIISSIRIPVDKYYDTLSEYLRINTYFKIKKRLLVELLKDLLAVNKSDLSGLQELIDNNKVSMEDKVSIGERELLQLQLVLDKESFLAFIKYIYQNGNNGDILHFNSLKVSIDEDKMVYRFIKNEFNGGLINKQTSI
jgi:DNA-binding XRE family transcriptional regulator